MRRLLTTYVIALYLAVFHHTGGYGETPVIKWVEQGHDAILYCYLAGTEESFDWTRGPNYTASTQHLLAYNNRGVIRGECLTQGKCELLGRNLKLKNAQIEDEDIYYCGTPKSYTTVTLKVTIEPRAPTINHCGQNKSCAIIFPVGFSLHLTCVVTGSRPPAELVWSYSTHLVTNGTNFSVYENQDGTSDTISFLHINHIAPTVYKCEAQGPSIQQSSKAIATINVTGTENSDKTDSLEPMSRYPEINYCGLQTNCSLTWPMRFPLQLQCTVRGFRNIVKLVWMHKHEDLTKKSTNETHRSNNGALSSVSTVTLHINESSAYHCVALGESNLNQTNSTIYISITESFPGNNNPDADGWKISTVVCVSLITFVIFGLLVWFLLRKRNKPFTKGKDDKEQCLQPVASKGVQESQEEGEKLLPTNEMTALASDEADLGHTPESKEKHPQVYQPSDNNTSLQSNGIGASPHGGSQLRGSTSSVEGSVSELHAGYDDTDLGHTPQSVQKHPQVYQPSDNDTALLSNESEKSPHGGSQLQGSTSRGEGSATELQVTSPATYPEKKEKLSDSEETTPDNSSSTSSEQGAVSPWCEGVGIVNGEMHEKLSSPKNKGRLITANLIRSKRRSFNFSLIDEESDILITFSMKGCGLIISFVPYLGPCDEGYIIHFQDQGNITFSKHGMKIDLSEDENCYDPSKKLNFILNIASKRVILMEERENDKRPLLRYSPVQTKLCSYLVISAHENSEFDMVLFPVR